MYCVHGPILGYAETDDKTLVHNHKSNALVELEVEEEKSQQSEPTICCQKDTEKHHEPVQSTGVSVQTSTEDLIPEACRAVTNPEGQGNGKTASGCCGGSFSCHYSNFVEKRTQISEDQKKEVDEK